MRGRGQLAILCIITLFGAGCVSTETPDLTTTAAAAYSKPVVIALLDSGTNPYLPIFRTVTEPDLSLLRVRATRIELSDLGSPNASLEADNETWSALQPNQLYHFAGTRLLAISLDENRDYPYTLDGDVHGSGTSYLAARDAPGAVIVSVQVPGGVCTTNASCLSDPEIANGMEWIAAQPWIDIVSISLALPGNPPDSAELHAEAGRFRRASEAAAASGKIIVNGAGNHLVAPLMSYFGGTPWVIAVGGVEPDVHGQALLSALTGLDVTANYTEWAPEYLDGEFNWRSGTSFATPVVAGTLAHAMQLVRDARPGERPTMQELRDALNASSIVLDGTPWKPGPYGKEPLLIDLVFHSTLPILVQPQTGWGYVNASLAPEIARRVIEQDFSIPAEKDQAMLFQPAWQKAREEY